MGLYLGGGLGFLVMLAVFIREEVKIIMEGFLKSFPGSEMRVNNRVGNMGRARWVGPLWLDILEGRTMKLAARIELRPIGLQPIWVRARPA